MRKWISVLILALVIISVFFYICSHREEFARLLTLKLWQYLILSLLVISGIAINGLIMKILVDFLGIKLRVSEWLGLAAITSAGNYLFFRGGALTKAVYLKKIHRFPYADFLSVFGVIHCINLLVIGILGIIGSAILCFTHSIFNFTIFIVFVLVFGGALFFMLSVPEKWPFDIRFTKYFNKLSKSWWMIRNSKAVMLKLIIASILNLLIMALRLWAAYCFLFYKLLFNQALLLALLGAISVFLGLVPAGLGIREAVIGFSLKLLGGQVSTGVIAASLDRAVAIIWFGLLASIFACLLSWRATRNVQGERNDK